MEKGQAHRMNGGKGLHSYAQNSSYQREVVAGVNSMISHAVFNKLDLEKYSLNIGTIRIADFGCSTGPNTILAMKIIVEAIQQKYSKALEFQVFFNDNVNNDFNTLFTTLSTSGQKYFAAGVPGSFQGRLFPKATLSIGFTSSSLHWLSKIPDEILDKNSPAWNKGTIFYSKNIKVLEAYSAQHKMEMDNFLSLRAQEMVPGGLLLLVLPDCPQVNEISTRNTLVSIKCEILTSCLMEMTRTGMISEEMVDSFNFPLHFFSEMELRQVIETNGCFTIEMMDAFVPSGPHLPTSHVRAATEELFTKHFGSHIIDHLFELYAKKVVQIPNSGMKAIEPTVFACLKLKF